MEIFGFIWNDLLYRPVYNLVLFTYVTLPGRDMGLTIIYLAVLMRIVLLPVTLAGSRSSRRIQELGPRLRQLARMPEAGKRRDLTRKVLKDNRVNIYATAFVLGIQVLFLGVLYAVFQSDLSANAQTHAYFELDQAIDTTFFGLFDLAQRNWWLPLITAVSLYALLSMNAPEPERGAKLSDVWYVIALPAAVFGILYLLPAAKSLFLLTSILFSVGLYFVAKYVFRVEPPDVSGAAE